MKTALVIFFNTDFSKNIFILEEIYSSRFSEILYLVPDHSSTLRGQYVDPSVPYRTVNTKDKIINKARRLARKKNMHEIISDSYDHKIERVVGFQYFFQDYFWQARKRILNLNADWYWFVSDDVLINPSYHEQNINDMALAKGGLSLISTVQHPSQDWADWFHKSIPDVIDKLQNLNCMFKVRTEMAISNNNYQTAPFQKNLVAGCSDIFAIHKSKIELFLNYCHQTALAKIFVELAIPNILLKHCDPVSFIEDYDWDFDMNRGDWNRVVEFLKSDKFYYHPVKLSLLSSSEIKSLVPGVTKGITHIGGVSPNHP